MKNFLFKLGSGLIVGAIIFGFVSWKDMVAAFSEPVDISVDYPDSYDDVKAVDTDIYELDGIFAEEEVTSDSSKSIYYYYVMPVYTADDD